MDPLSLPGTPPCGGGLVIFLGGKKSSNGDTVFWNGNILSQTAVLKKKTSPNSNRNWGVIKFMPTVPSIHPHADFDLRPLVISSQTRNQCGLHQGMEKPKHTGSVSVCHGVELGGLTMLAHRNKWLGDNFAEFERVE
jgi:hypothetical protein